MHVAHTDHPVPLLHPLQGPGLLRQGAQDHVAPAVADPGGHPDQHDLPRFLGELEGVGDHVLGLLHRRGLQQGDARGHRLPAGVELVGGGVGAGVVAGDDHKPPLYPGLGGAVERVRHAQKAVLLHYAQSPAIGQGRARAGLQGADLVGGPLRVKAPLPGNFSQHSQHLGGGRAGVGGGEIDSGLHRAPHDGLVTLHQADLAGDASRHCPFHAACVTLSMKIVDSFCCFASGDTMRYCSTFNKAMQGAEREKARPLMWFIGGMRRGPALIGSRLRRSRSQREKGGKACLSPKHIRCI